ncbi:MAG: MoaD/ThiS family protein [Gammaproteobacteria bacterium]|nr:MoaD/ThiS family protein [Gammaproteobacteria bacterium]MBT8443308.1 MoaD/ThiS family protein [Gammaproteobacteria bacterium]NND37764.1 MoaD/ThiS family protein [Gammaproteobacteria bacterium]
MPSIRVEYFAILREKVGKSAENLQTSAETASALFDELAARHGFSNRAGMKVAINDEFSDWNAALADGDSVVFIPPVAGG